MNHVLSETYNIDTVIQNIQTSIYNELKLIWHAEMDGYGRVYKNEYKGDVIPEVYDKNREGYKETYYNNNTCFFFIDDDTHQTEDQRLFRTNVKICFMVNLNMIKPSSERLDQDVKRDVISIIREKVYEDFTITEYEKGIDNVFRGFKTDKIKENDMHPLHVFSINGILRYYVTDKCN